MPGLILWALVQLTWAVAIGRAYIESRHAGDVRWAGLFVFLAAYWMACLINASFDVFLEGPMGGIWFWTIYGVGLAAMRIYRVRPELFGPRPRLGRFSRRSSPMIILIAHNYYQQPGGEDQVFASEAGLLEARGHRVVRFTRSNDEIDRMGRPALFAATLWNRRHSFGAECRDPGRAAGSRPLPQHVPPDLPGRLRRRPRRGLRRGADAAQLSPDVPERRVPPRRSGLRALPRAAPAHGRAWSMAAIGRAAPPAPWSPRCSRPIGPSARIGAWSTRYIAPSEFARRKFILGGLPPEKIVVKPNFVAPDPGPGEGRGGYALFVGRLSRGKGLETLLAAWPRLHRPFPLKIIGDGDLADLARDAAWRWPHVQWLGHRAPGRGHPDHG